jgi:hypothetical protein
VKGTVRDYLKTEQTDKDTHKQIDKDTCKQIDKDTYRLTGRQKKDTYKQTNRQINMHAKLKRLTEKETQSK